VMPCVELRDGGLGLTVVDELVSLQVAARIVQQVWHNRQALRVGLLACVGRLEVVARRRHQVALLWLESMERVREQARYLSGCDGDGSFRSPYPGLLESRFW
jgi:hypothetical protein